MRATRSPLTSILALAIALLGLAAIPAPARAVGAGDGFITTLWGEPTEADLRESVRLADDMGARHITFLVFLSQDSPTASEVRFQAAPAVDTPFDSMRMAPRYRSAIADARSRGLTVGLIAFPFEPGMSKRHFWNPKDKATWFRTYGARLADLARFAQREGVDEICVGSELSLLFQFSSGWRGVISQVRREFAGHVTISSTWPDYGLIRFWDACDSIGVSGYFPLALRESTFSASSFEAYWRVHKAHLLAASKLWRKPINFVEVGYPTSSVAAKTPWDFNFSRPYEPYRQVLCFEAFRRVWGSDARLRRFQIWGHGPVDLSKPAADRMGFSPIGHPAETVVRQLLQERAR